MQRLVFGALLVTGFVLTCAPAKAQTLEAVKARGVVNCGVSQGLFGFSSSDEKSEWTGLDVDLCRALAAAIFNDPGKVAFVPLATNERFAALSSGTIDVLVRNTTWTMSRETSFGFKFAAITYYDGQGFLIPRAMKIETALELNGKSVCAQTDTTTELNAADFFAANNIRNELIRVATVDEAVSAYDAGRCTVLTSDISQLHALRLKLSKPDDHIILPDVISKEPLGPVVRNGDDQWFNIVKWIHFAMLNAEELGVNSKNVDEASASARPDVKRLLGIEGNFGQDAGLTNDWAARVIKLVGNYEEVFERNIGTGSQLGIPRGLNNLWTNGGIHYAPPIR